jgi:cation diffusion facilitator family transporter
MKKKQAALLAILGGVLVLLIKLVAYFVSNSVALLSDALESIVNIAASGLMLFSVFVSEKPADDSHKYGHERIENLSCLLEGLLIIVAAFLIVNAAAGRLFEPALLLELNLGIGISMLATGLNAGLSWFLARTARKSGSAALEGDSKHLLSDVISSVGVWLGLFVAEFTGWGILDPVLAFIVAALIVRMGAGLIWSSSHNLMDRSCPEEENKIAEVLLRHKPSFVNFHDVKTRRHGNRVFAEMHLTVEGSISVEEAHSLADHLEEELKQELPWALLTIHVEPGKRTAP